MHKMIFSMIYFLFQQNLCIAFQKICSRYLKQLYFLLQILEQIQFQPWLFWLCLYCYNVQTLLILILDWYLYFDFFKGFDNLLLLIFECLTSLAPWLETGFVWINFGFWIFFVAKNKTSGGFNTPLKPFTRYWKTSLFVIVLLELAEIFTKFGKKSWTLFAHMIDQTVD